MAHLCIGDTWNAITNVERRLGTSALYVLCVLASVYYAVSSYFAAVRARWIGAVHLPSDSARLMAPPPPPLSVCCAQLPLAGLLLAPSACWLTIATVLTWTIWSINGKDPLLPKVGDGKGAPLRLPLSTPFEK